MPQGANVKREREYKKLVSDFRREGRYRGREEEVAARVVNKQRAALGETKGAKERERHGQSADRDLPVKGYSHLTVPQIARRIQGLSKPEIRRLMKFEKSHKQRKSLLVKLERYL